MAEFIPGRPLVVWIFLRFHLVKHDFGELTAFALRVCSKNERMFSISP